MSLTPTQTNAVENDGREILCVAGPGAGKTTVLVRRICRLIESGVLPEKIVALTFTNAAARELERRLYSSAVDPAQGGFPRLGYCGTLHGFALKMLKKEGGRIGYGERIAIIGQEAADDLILSKAQQLGCKTRLGNLLKLKESGRPTGARLSPDQLVICGYFDDLREAGMVDFDIMLTEFLRMLNKDAEHYSSNWGDFTHLFVDEVQDSGTVDWQIYRALPMAHKFFVGDPDQAIYGFRGGRVHEMVAFGHRPSVTRIMLEENFRSRDEICNAATSLIGNNTERIPKATVGMSGPGGWLSFEVCMNEGEEIARCAAIIQRNHLKEVAVLARTNGIAATLRAGLEALGVVVAAEERGDHPKDWQLARQFVAWLAQPENDTLAYFYIIARQLRAGDPAALARAQAHDYRREAQAQGKTINGLWFNHGRTTLADLPRMLAKAEISAEARMIIATKIKQLPADADLLELSLALAVPEDRPAPEANPAQVAVTTIHAAKGREFDAVIIVGFEDEVIPGRAGKTPKEATGFQRAVAESAQREGVEEERRLAYVALTRARQACYITCAKVRAATWGYHPLEEHTPSRFVKEILR